MYSNIQNLFNQQVVRLEYSGIVAQIDDSGTVTAYSPTMLLELNKTYVINRFYMGLSYFLLPLLAGYMFPNPPFEQYFLGLTIRCDIADSAGNGVKNLFTGLNANFTTGYRQELLMREPFTFTTDTKRNRLYFVNTDNGSVVSTLSTPAAPPGALIKIYGTMILEGYQVVPSSPIDIQTKIGNSQDAPVPDLEGSILD